MGSAYYFVIPGFCIAIGRYFDLTQLFAHTTSKTIYFGCTMLPLIFFYDSAYAVLELLVPVMGRAGPVVPSGILYYI